jgi:hypothetical protein
MCENKHGCIHYLFCACRYMYDPKCGLCTLTRELAAMSSFYIEAGVFFLSCFQNAPILP